MRRLVPREDVHVVEVLEGAAVAAGRDAELLEEGAGQVGRVGARGGGEQEGGGEGFGGGEDAGDVAVEGEGFTPSVAASSARAPPAGGDALAGVREGGGGGG